MARSNEWSRDNGPDDDTLATGTGKGLTPGQAAHVERLVNWRIVKSWEELDVDFSDIKGRQEMRRLLEWFRDRKVRREAGMSKLFGAVLASTVSAAVGAAFMWVTGRHP